MSREEIKSRWAVASDAVQTALGGSIERADRAAAFGIMVEDAREIAKLRAERDTATADLKHALETLGSEFGVEAWTEQLRRSRELTSENVELKAELQYVDDYTRLVAAGNETAEADEIRDGMDGPWWRMNQAGRDRINRLLAAVVGTVDISEDVQELRTRYAELARSLSDTVDGSEEWSHERLCLWTKREGRRVRHACDLREQRTKIAERDYATALNRIEVLEDQLRSRS